MVVNEEVKVVVELTEVVSVVVVLIDDVCVDVLLIDELKVVVVLMEVVIDVVVVSDVVRVVVDVPELVSVVEEVTEVVSVVVEESDVVIEEVVLPDDVGVVVVAGHRITPEGQTSACTAGLNCGSLQANPLLRKTRHSPPGTPISHSKSVQIAGSGPGGGGGEDVVVVTQSVSYPSQQSLCSRHLGSQ